MEQQLFEGHFAHSLTEAEKAQLQQLRVTNPELDADITLGEQIGRTYRLNEQQRLKALLKQEETAFRQQTTATTPSGGMNVWVKRAAFALAAALVPIIAFIFWPKAQTPETLFADAFVVPDNRLRAAGGGQDEIEQMRAQASAQYDQKQYDKAAVTFGQLAIRQPDQPAMHYYQGVSLLAAGDFEAAMTPLEQTIRIGTSPYQSNAYWYLALAQLRTNRSDEAISSIKSYLQNNNAVYKERAEVLLKALEKK
jgi:tetratricopeptide (TPR) repeat protein